MIKSWTTCLIALGLGCLPCLAQTALEPPDASRYVRWGALRVRPGFRVSNLGYEDNIFLETQNEVGDYLATWSPQVQGLVMFGDRAFVTFKERLNYTTYLEHTDQNHLDQLGSARVTFPLQQTGLYVEGVLNRVTERPVDELDTRRKRDEDGLGFGVILVPGWRSEVEIGSSWTDLSYSDADDTDSTIPEQLDRTEFSNTIKLAYRAVGRTRVTLDGYIDSIEFAGSESSGRDTRGWGVMPGINFGEGGQLSGSARIGWAEIDARDPAFPDFADLVGQAELAYRPNPAMTFRLDGDRKPGFTLSGDTTYFLNTRAALRAVYYFNRILGVETGGSVARLTFPGSATSRRDKTDSYQVGLRFRLAENASGRRIEFSLRMQHYRRESTDPNQNRTRTTIGFGADVGY